MLRTKRFRRGVIFAAVPFLGLALGTLNATPLGALTSQAQQHSLSKLEKREVKVLMHNYSVKDKKVKQQHTQAVGIVERLTAKGETLPGFGQQTRPAATKPAQQSPYAYRLQGETYHTPAGCHVGTFQEASKIALSPFSHFWLASPVLHVDFCNNKQDKITSSNAWVDGGLDDWSSWTGFEFKMNTAHQERESRAINNWVADGSINTCYGISILKYCSYADGFELDAVIYRQSVGPHQIQDTIVFNHNGTGSHYAEVHFDGGDNHVETP